MDRGQGVHSNIHICYISRSALPVHVTAETYSGVAFAYVSFQICSRPAAAYVFELRRFYSSCR